MVVHKTVAIQGVGSVGFELAKLIARDGGNIVFTDISKTNIERLKEQIPEAQFVESDKIFDVDCDVYAPCALGASIDDETIPRLKCKVVAGAANNQLKESSHGKALIENGILYAPDYLINAGGLMNVSIEFEGWADSKSRRMINTIYDTTLNIFDISDEQGIPTNQAADVLAETRIDQMRKIQKTYLGKSSHHRFPGQKGR
jgi:leucine dehydrogenase